MKSHFKNSCNSGYNIKLELHCMHCTVNNVFDATLEAFNSQHALHCGNVSKVVRLDFGIKSKRTKKRWHCINLRRGSFNQLTIQNKRPWLLTFSVWQFCSAVEKGLHAHSYCSTAQISYYFSYKNH